MLSIQTNVNSMQAQENLRLTNNFQGRTIARLTSGYRINESGDDAAGLAISNKYRSDVTELMQGVRNANDGLSTLQIIDGGLNNISKILDRLKTLATQSASATFTGSRATLQAEYSSLLTEIDRQAANIGLGGGAGDTNAARNNADIKVYLGGGSQTSNSQVSVNLAGSSNIVNAAGLSLGATTIDDNTASVALGNTDIRTASNLLVNSTQAFRFGTANGQINITVTGDGDGITGADVVNQLNQGLAGTGVGVSINATTGFLQVKSTNAYAVAADAVVGGGTGAAPAITDANAKVNTSKYYFDAGTMSNSDAAQVITVTPASGGAKTINIAATDNDADMVFNKVKVALAGSGIDAVRIGDEMVFQSDADFTVARDATADAGGLGNVAASSSASAQDKAAAAGDPTVDALAALSAIATAVTRLGSVQGKVGTGQNRLQYAIQLAQSQITSFSAAESRIRDADVAQEAANLTKAQVLQQASLAALAQANSAPQAVLSLLRG